MTAPKINAAVIIYGPEGCGKTRNAEHFARMYGKTKIIEANQDQVECIKFSKRGTMHCAGLNPDTLYLTFIDWNCINAPGALIVSFDAALSMLREDVG